MKISNFFKNEQPSLTGGRGGGRPPQKDGRLPSPRVETPGQFLLMCRQGDDLIIHFQTNPGGKTYQKQILIVHII